MTIQLASLIPAQQLGTAAALLYVSPSGVTTRIDSLAVINTTGAAAQVTLYLVPPSGTAGPSTMTTSAQTVLPGQTWNSPNEVGKVLAAGGAIYGFASAATALTIVAGGIQATA